MITERCVLIDSMEEFEEFPKDWSELGVIRRHYHASRSRLRSSFVFSWTSSVEMATVAEYSTDLRFQILEMKRNFNQYISTKNISIVLRSCSDSPGWWLDIPTNERFCGNSSIVCSPFPWESHRLPPQNFPREISSTNNKWVDPSASRIIVLCGPNYDHWSP